MGAYSQPYHYIYICLRSTDIPHKCGNKLIISASPPHDSLALRAGTASEIAHLIYVYYWPWSSSLVSAECCVFTHSCNPPLALCRTSCWTMD